MSWTFPEVVGQKNWINSPSSTCVVLSRASEGGQPLRVAHMLGDKVSYETVRRTALRSGLHPYHRARKPLVTDATRKRRLAFARQYKDFNWRNVIFSDETRFSVHPRLNAHNDVVWAERAEDVESIPSVAHSPSINAYGAICFRGQLPIHLFDRNLDAEYYCSILEKTMLPSARDLFPRGQWVYQQDGDPKHTAAV